jgi:hypothetical protein
LGAAGAQVLIRKTEKKTKLKVGRSKWIFANFFSLDGKKKKFGGFFFGATAMGVADRAAGDRMRPPLAGAINQNVRVARGEKVLFTLNPEII